LHNGIADGQNWTPQVAVVSEWRREEISVGLFNRDCMAHEDYIRITVETDMGNAKAVHLEPVSPQVRAEETV
jgi:hypothetical protein